MNSTVFPWLLTNQKAIKKKVKICGMETFNSKQNNVILMIIDLLVSHI